MRTSEERKCLISRRTAEIRRENQKKKGIRQTALCMAACLLLVIGIGVGMPGWMEAIPESDVSHTSAAASLVGSHAALGYILMGLLAFLLGVCVTMLLYRLRRRDKGQDREDRNDDEL